MQRTLNVVTCNTPVSHQRRISLRNALGSAPKFTQRSTY